MAEGDRSARQSGCRNRSSGDLDARARSESLAFKLVDEHVKGVTFSCPAGHEHPAFADFFDLHDPHSYRLLIRHGFPSCQVPHL